MKTSDILKEFFQENGFKYKDRDWLDTRGCSDDPAGIRFNVWPCPNKPLRHYGHKPGEPGGEFMIVDCSPHVGWCEPNENKEGLILVKGAPHDCLGSMTYTRLGSICLCEPNSLERLRKLLLRID